MCLDSISEDEEMFPIATIHDFGRNMEPLGFEDVEPSLGSLEPPNALPSMDVCCNKVCEIYQPERFDEKLQSLSLCMDCNENQVQVMLVPCKHLSLCEPCANYAIICPICCEVIDGTIRVYVGFNLRKKTM